MLKKTVIKVGMCSFFLLTVPNFGFAQTLTRQECSDLDRAIIALSRQNLKILEFRQEIAKQSLGLVVENTVEAARQKKALDIISEKLDWGIVDVGEEVLPAIKVLRKHCRE